MGLALFLLAAPAPALAESPWAGEVTPENAARRLVGGPDAVGGIGDFALGNGLVCAVVSHPSQAMDISPGGGFLVDLGHCGGADDHLSNLVPLVNVSRANVPRVESVAAEFDPDEARIITTARWNGVEIRTVYALAAGEASLRIATEVERVASGGRFALLGLLSVHPSGSLRVFTLDTALPELSAGFEHPSSPGEEWSSIFRGLERADVQVLLADDGFGAGIAYGLHFESAVLEREDEEPVAVPMVALNGIPFTVLGVFTRPFWMGGGPRVGLLEIAQAPFMDLDEGATLRLRHRMHVGERVDVASVTDRLFADGPVVSGRVDDPGARLHVSRDGQATTYARPEADGRFAFRVPSPGGYELRVVASGGREVRLPVEVAAEGLALGEVALGGVGRVVLPRGHAMRLVFQGLDGTRDPDFRDDLLGLSYGGDPVRQSALSSDISLAGTEDDPASAALPPGRYRVLATRGLEWSVEETLLDVRVGENTPLTIGLPRRTVKTPGWILADLHVHAAGSFDSTLPYRERLRSFAAMGGEVLVATEHDNVVDYRPTANAMGLEGRMRVVPGLEVTSILRSEAVPHTTGHANAFPLLPEPFVHRGGALTSQGVRLRTPIAELRARGGERIFQLNHPRPVATVDTDDESFLSHLAIAGRPFDPTLSLDQEPNRVLIEPDPETGVRDVDFDAIELLNGATGPLNSAYKQTRADWFSLLLQGERSTGTANSDSHRLGRLVAVPASFVRVPDDRPARLDEAAFFGAILRGELVGSTGPFLTARLGKVGPGGLISAREATLSIAVDAPDWVPVAEARVYLNGALVETRPIERGGSVEVPLAFEGDAFVTVEVEGDATGDEAERYRVLVPNSVPFAFTNPIFVDPDGNGWEPPGLPAELPPTLTDPLAN
ncbi:MAG: CehA/McbA family metallohydrolase [Deltaproteobacteria bacterium]|nr:CehA/McbA family metallohydrolase [Deltaproteobacteria bacterium]